MKNNKLTLLPTAALAVGAFLLLASNDLAADTKTKLNSADTRFLQKEAAAGAAMVRIAELGVKKAERSEVKDFAGVLVADHTKGNAELTTLAERKGVELTSKVDSKHTDTYEDLEGERGADFDKEFLSVIVSGHKKCVKNFKDAAEDVEDSEVKSWAAKTLPALEAHLEKAEELRSSPTVKTADAAQARTTTTATEPGNTARNMRDRDTNTLTPLDQGNSKTDIDTTAQIRKAVLDLEDISVNAQNVKIITKEGHVTLRGRVNSAEEKRLIGEIANRAVTSGNADNQLEVKGATTSN